MGAVHFYWAEAIAVVKTAETSKWTEVSPGQLKYPSAWEFHRFAFCSWAACRRRISRKFVEHEK